MKGKINSNFGKMLAVAFLGMVFAVSGTVNTHADDDSGKTTVYSRKTAPTIKFGERYNMELDDDQTTYYKLVVNEKTKIKLKARTEGGHFLLTSAYGYELFNSDGIDKEGYDDEPDVNGETNRVWMTDRTFILSKGTYYVGFTTTFYNYSHIDYAYFRVYQLDMTDFEKASERSEYDISLDNVATISEVENRIKTAKFDKDIAGSTYSLLNLTGTQKGNNKIKLKWKKVKEAKNYTIYGNKCGGKNKYKKIATVSKNSYVQKKLKKGTYYKYIVVANTSTNVIAVSKTVHVATKGGKVGNFKKVKAKKSVTIRVNKTYKVKAKPVKEKLTPRNHRRVAFESSDVRIATVDKNGKIRGIGKGKCYVYAYAQDGKAAKIKVTIKE